jgi:hypothetical protein
MAVTSTAMPPKGGREMSVTEHQNFNASLAHVLHSAVGSRFGSIASIPRRLRDVG